MKVGTKTIDEWNTLAYTYDFNLELKTSAIEELTHNEPHFQKKYEMIDGNPIVKFSKEDLLAYFSFDEGMIDGGDKVKEAISNLKVPVIGHDTYWTKGRILFCC